MKVSVNSDFFISTKPNLRDMNFASTSDLIDFEQDVYNRERARFANTSSMFSSYGDIGNSSMKYYSPLYQLNRNLEEGKSVTQIMTVQSRNGERTITIKIIAIMYGKMNLDNVIMLPFLEVQPDKIPMFR